MLRPGGEVVAYGSSPQPLNLPFVTLISKNVQLKFFMVYHLSDADRARAQGALQRFLDHIEKHDGVWITRRIDIARHWQRVHPFAAAPT